MKKGSILLVGVLAMFATSCGFKSEESPLSGTLVTYTAEGTQKGEILLGVKDKAGKKDKTIVPADTYVSITADNNYIICVQENADYSVFDLSGNKVGPQTFHTFSKQPVGDNVFYAGTAAGTSYYYFPGKPEISCTLSYMTAKNLIVQKVSNIWDVYSYDGTLVWNFPAEAILIKSATTEEYVVVAPVVKKKKATVYKLYLLTSGKELKQLNAYQWKVFKKQLKNPQKLGSTEVYELETVKIEKLTI